MDFWCLLSLSLSLSLPPLPPPSLLRISTPSCVHGQCGTTVQNASSMFRSSNLRIVSTLKWPTTLSVRGNSSTL